MPTWIRVDFSNKKIDLEIVRLLASFFLLSTYLVGAILGIPASFADARQFVQITHLHVQADHEHGKGHDHVYFGRAKAAHPRTASQSGEHDDQAVPHSHCISVPGTLPFYLRVQSIKISPLLSTPQIPIASDDRTPDDPPLASIFRPPIA